MGKREAFGLPPTTLVEMFKRDCGLRLRAQPDTAPSGRSPSRTPSTGNLENSGREAGHMPVTPGMRARLPRGGRG
jgi:hypothetical protein